MTIRTLHVPIANGLAGNTLIHVSAKLSEIHASHGGDSAVVLSDNRDAHISSADNILVDYSKYCPREWFNKNELLLDAALGASHLRRRYMGRLFLPAIVAAKRWEPDVILLYEGHTLTSLPYWRDVFPDTSLYLYVHSSPSRSILDQELRRLTNLTDGIICVSDDTRRALNLRLRNRGASTYVVRNGVDSAFFKPKRPVSSRATFDILFAGQVTSDKGPHLLLSAVARAQKSTDVPLKVRIIGSSSHDGHHPLQPYEISLRNIATELHLNVEFVPFIPREELRNFYCDASIVCVPSVFSENFGLVVLEAMACGTAVVTSSRGGLPEAAGDAAIYVDPADTETFARTLTLFAETPELVENFEKKGLRRARSFSWEQTYRQLMDVISR